jgi:hypothetical protein
VRLRGRRSSPYRNTNCHFPISSRPALVSTQPPIRWVLGATSPGLKRQGREAHHSPPTSAEVKKTWVYTSPPCAFMAKHRDNSTFYLTLTASTESHTQIVSITNYILYYISCKIYYIIIIIYNFFMPRSTIEGTESCKSYKSVGLPFYFITLKRHLTSAHRSTH